MEYQEFTGKSVDDALTKASVALGVTSDRIDYEVVEKGSSGFLGIGASDAVIRARVRTDEETFDVKADDKEKSQEVSPKDFSHEDGAGAERPRSEEKETTAPMKQTSGRRRSSQPATDEEVRAAIDAAEKFLKDVFEKMELTVDMKFDFDPENQFLNVDLQGPDMGVIIGKRGQTLDSLQYLTGLVVSRKTGSYIRIKMDTENYRERREATLENLAHNVAYKVKRTGKSVSLEAMNPYERRIIHSALSDDEEVSTHSEGEEPYRHVVVTLK